MKNNDNKQISINRLIPKKEKAYLQNFDFAALSIQFSSVLCFRAIYILLTHRYIYIELYYLLKLIDFYQNWN